VNKPMSRARDIETVSLRDVVNKKERRTPRKKELLRGGEGEEKLWGKCEVVGGSLRHSPRDTPFPHHMLGGGISLH
jgi:hypothetical protein